MNSKVPKLGLIAVFIITSIAVLGAHTTDRLFPWLPALLGVSALLLLAIGPRVRLLQWVGLAAAIGVFYRVYVAMWPASMIAVDPDKFAGTVARIIAAGDLSRIQNLSFYSQAPLSQLFAAETGIVTGLPSRHAVLVYAVALGVLLAFGTAAVARRMAGGGRTGAYAAGIAAILATIAPDTLLFGYGPISQSSAVVLWVGLLVAFSRYFHRNSLADRLIFTVFLFGMVFSHKLGVVLVVGCISVGAVIGRINRFQVREIGHGSNYQPHETGKRLLAIAGLFFAVQTVFLTNWIQAIVISAIVPIVTFSFSPGRVITQTYPVAQPSPETFMHSLLQDAYWPILLAIAGIAALLVWRRDDSPLTAFVLGGTATVAVYIVLSFVSSGASVQRVLFYSEPVLAIVIAVGIARLSVDSSNAASESRTTWTVAKRSLAAVVLCLLVVSQAGAADTVPDYPNDTRFYLNDAEVTAKEFARANAIDPVIADEYYAIETVVFDRRDVPYWFGTRPNNTKFRGPGTALLEGRQALMRSNDWTYFLYRRNVGVYRTAVGYYRLQWNPERTLDAATSSVYANGEVTLYWR